MKTDDSVFCIPNCYKLIYYLLLFPLNTARVFSKMKLIKTCLRKHLSQSTLENLLFNEIEARQDFQNDHYEHFINGHQRLKTNTRIFYKQHFYKQRQAEIDKKIKLLLSNTLRLNFFFAHAIIQK